MKKLCLFTFALLSCIAINAQTVSNADAATLARIKQANEKHSSITSSFKQTKNMPVLGEKILSNGTFYYNKPEQLAMIYNDPKGDLLIISNDKMVMVSSGKRRDASTKSNAKTRGMKNILASFIQGNIMQAGADKIVTQEKDDYIIVTVNIGKANKSNIKKVVASYHKSDLTIASIRTEDSDNVTNDYELIGKRLNQPIDQAVFNTSKK